METRVNEILAELDAFDKEAYEKSQLLPELMKLQVQMAEKTLGKDAAKNKIYDVYNYFKARNAACGNTQAELLKKFKQESSVFCEMIKGEISGGIGEKKAYKSLQTAGGCRRLLRNVELAHGDHRTEIDIVAVTNSGIFLIEVKNTARDIVIDEKGNYCRITSNGRLVLDKNIGEQMNEKEYLLRTTLANAGIKDVVIQSLVVFTNSGMSVENRYPYIRACYLGQLPHEVTGGVARGRISDRTVIAITKAITDAQDNGVYQVEDCIISLKTTFATLLASLEADERAKAQKEARFTYKVSGFFKRLFTRAVRAACFMW